MPALVLDAYERAEREHFTMSCEPEVGALLSVLAAAVPDRGRILEIGTGVGAGTAWIVSGLTNRMDVEVVTVEMNAETARIAMHASWPPYVRFVIADILTVFDDLGLFDLVFADGQGGKWFGLERTIATLQPGGQLIVDDMEPSSWSLPDQAEKAQEVRLNLITNNDLVSVELHASSGMILATRLRDDIPTPSDVITSPYG